MESMAQIGRLIGRCDVEEEIYKIFQSDSVERTAKLRSIRRRMGPSWLIHSLFLLLNKWNLPLLAPSFVSGVEDISQRPDDQQENEAR